MRRKEQEARIEQQRQEKEKAREDAARERARYVVSNPFSMEVYIHWWLHQSPFNSNSHIDKLSTCIYMYSCFTLLFCVLSEETERSVWLLLVLLNRRPWRSCRRKFR